jgi:putative ABC transport system permease protein
VEASLNTLLYKNGNERNKQLNTLSLQPLKKIHLYASDIGGNPSTGNIAYIYIFGGIALLILFIATVNFINLATAQASARSREVGMRKVLGANKNQLVLQFLSEALMISFIALLLAFILTQLSLPVLNELTGKQVLLQSWFNLQNLGLFVSIFFITGVASGAYPAFFIARFLQIFYTVNRYKLRRLCFQL